MFTLDFSKILRKLARPVDLSLSALQAAAAGAYTIGYLSPEEYAVVASAIAGAQGVTAGHKAKRRVVNGEPL